MNKCENSKSSGEPGSSFEDDEEDLESPFIDFNWKTVVIGFVVGVVVGVIIENTVKTKKRELCLGKTDYLQRRRARRVSEEETLELEY